MSDRHVFGPEFEMAFYDDAMNRITPWFPANDDYVGRKVDHGRCARWALIRDADTFSRFTMLLTLAEGALHRADVPVQMWQGRIVLNRDDLENVVSRPKTEIPGMPDERLAELRDHYDHTSAAPEIRDRQEEELWAVYEIAEKVTDQWQAMRRSYPSDEESNQLGDLLDELTYEVRR